MPPYKFCASAPRYLSAIAAVSFCKFLYLYTAYLYQHTFFLENPTALLPYSLIVTLIRIVALYFIICCNKNNTFCHNARNCCIAKCNSFLFYRFNLMYLTYLQQQSFLQPQPQPQQESMSHKKTRSQQSIFLSHPQPHPQPQPLPQQQRSSKIMNISLHPQP